MTRFWFGIICMLVLLAIGLGSMTLLNRYVESVVRELEQTLSAAGSENWALAKESLARARANWSDGWHLLAGFLSHGPMEEADSLLEELETYLSARESLPFQAVCVRLLSLLRAVQEGQRPLWWNLL